MPEPLDRRRRRTTPTLVVSLLTAVGALALAGPPPAHAAGQPTGDARATVETQPTGHAGDSADDPAIWRHPTDPARSVVIGNDKGGALEVYDLQGSRIQRLTGGFFGNVDVLPGVRTGRGTVDLVVTYRAGLRVYAMDPASRQLRNVTDASSGSIPTPAGGEGLCLYRSPEDGAAYAFSNTRDGHVSQFALTDADRDGEVEGREVRSWDVGSEIEGCVADPGTGQVFISEENVGIWRYGAEPEDSTSRRTLVDDLVSRGGHLSADVEGLALVDQGEGAGYLLASAQAPYGEDNDYVVYERRSPHRFVRTFRVVAGPAVDGCSHTDGIAALAADLGPAFPEGLFVCQDDRNTAPGRSGNQNFKLVPLERVVGLDGAAAPVPTPPPANRPPRAVAATMCEGLTCRVSAAGSTDADGSVRSYRWDFGDGTTAGGRAATHTYRSPGTRTVTLTVVDDDGAAARTRRTVTVSRVVFVGQSSSNANVVRHRVVVPSRVRAGDGLLLLAGSNTTASLSAPAGWRRVGTATGHRARSTVWAKVATAEDAGAPAVVTAGRISKVGLVLAAYRGTSTADPVAAVARTAERAGRSTHVTPTATVAEPAPVLSFWTHKDSRTSRLDPPDGVTVRAGGSQRGSGRVTTLLADSGSALPAGRHGAQTATAAAGSTAATSWTLVLDPG